MFIGHYAIAFGAKRLAPQVSLGTLFIACELADLVWPVLVLLGIEVVAIRPGATRVTPLDFLSYPWSHSLVAMAAWAVLFALIHKAVRRTPWAIAAILAGVVLSHWALDVLSHRPDMPVTLHGSARLGLGLWYSMPATLAVESLLFAIGVALYARTTAPRDRAGRIGFIALVAFLSIIYVGNLFGPPPPSPEAVAWSGIAMWLLVAWGYWLDRHRKLIGSDFISRNSET
ncbi:MAG TPA: hypothetical protein VFP44_08400 [Usitatibacter sp.]|nr:hypothetical protein [Usitatibacter sp.]